MSDEHPEPLEIDLDKIDVSRPEYFQNDTKGIYFERLRRECPVHYCAKSRFGPFWSITRFNDIMAIEKDHHTFSSDAFLGSIQLTDFPKGTQRSVTFKALLSQGANQPPKGDLVSMLAH